MDFAPCLCENLLASCGAARGHRKGYRRSSWGLDFRFCALAFLFLLGLCLFAWVVFLLCCAFFLLEPVFLLFRRALFSAKYFYPCVVFVGSFRAGGAGRDSARDLVLGVAFGRQSFFSFSPVAFLLLFSCISSVCLLLYRFLPLALPFVCIVAPAFLVPLFSPPSFVLAVVYADLLSWGCPDLLSVAPGILLPMFVFGIWEPLSSGYFLPFCLFGVVTSPFLIRLSLPLPLAVAI